jgi:hypothetical protein
MAGGGGVDLRYEWSDDHWQKELRIANGLCRRRNVKGVRLEDNDHFITLGRVVEIRVGDSVRAGVVNT